MTWRVWQLRCAIAMAGGAVLAGCSAAQPSAPPPNSARTTPSDASSSGEVTGASSLPARWWVWSESAPVDRNPIDDGSGADCALNQPDDVWFLAGTHGGDAIRLCDVPADRPVYVPVLNRICGVGENQTVEQAISECSIDTSTVTTVAMLDGAALPVTAATSTTSFPFTTQPGSSSGFAPGTHTAVAWGLWVGPLKLTNGTHVLAFKGIAGSFTTSVGYSLTVG